MQIADYFASFSLKIDKASVKKADATLDRIEGRLNGMGGGRGFRLGKFSINQGKLDATLMKAVDAASLKAVFNISKFDVNQTALNIALGNALDIASVRNTFHISKFNIDQSHLNAQMTTAMAAAARIASATTTLRPHLAGQGLGATERAVSRRGAAVTGGIAGGLSRLYAPALGLALGGYGLSQLNQRNQQVVSAELQSQSVIQQAMGDSYTPEAGKASFAWLKDQANETGFNYLDAVPSYNKLLSGVTGAGMSVQQGQGIFKGFSQLARVNKLDKVQQGRLFKGLSDVAGKDQLMSEELTGQLAEVLPGAVSLFAEAYQRQVGGTLTGSAATKALRAAMKDRKVTGSILTVAGDIAAERAAPGLEKAKTASQAEQQRYQNSVSDLAVVASDAGVEEGFARIFRTLSAGLSESNDLVKTLAEGFNDATKWADDLLLWPQSFIRALEGKDSLVADWLGKEQTAQLITDWTQIKSLWADINSVKAPDWLPALESTTKELKSLLDAIAKLKGTSDQAKGIVQEEYDKDPSVWGNIKGVAKANWFTFKNVVDAVNPINMEQAGANWDYWLGNTTSPDVSPTDLSSMQYDDENSRRQLALDAAQAASEDSVRARLRDSFTNYSSGGFRLPSSNSVMNTLGLFPTHNTSDFSNKSFQDSPEYQPILLDNGSKSAYQPSNPQEMADWNKSAAMAAADQAVTNNNSQSNQFDISISIDGATLMGMDVAGQGQALADALTAQVTAAFEHVQTSFPTRE